MAAAVKSCEKKCALAKSKIDRVVTSIAIGDGIDIPKATLHLYMKMITNAYDSYCELHNELIFLTDDAEKQMQYDFELIAVEKTYISTHQVLFDAIEKLVVNTEPSDAVQVNSKPIFTTGLPQTPLPVFDGQYENWYKFKALFMDIMAKYPNESDATKLYHLEKSLIGKATGAIDQQTLKDNNYNGAWKILTDRFENLRTIIDIHVNALLHLKSMTNATASELNSVVVECVRHVEALKFHNKDMTGMSEIIVINLIVSRLDNETRKLWESTVGHGQLPTYDATIKFLQTRASILERVEAAEASTSDQKAKQRPSTNKRNETGKTHTATSAEKSGDVCDVCQKQHTIYKCDAFKAMTVESRFSKAKELRLCFNCLRRNHRTVDCQSKWKCSVCDGRHHVLLHFNKAKNITQATGTNNEVAPNSTGNHTNVSEASLCHASTSDQILLSTAMVYVVDACGMLQEARVLLDSGSQKNFISERLSLLLNLERKAVNMQIVGINGEKINVKFQVRARVQSKVTPYTASLDFLIVPKVTCSLPQAAFDISSWRLPAGIQFADPGFNAPGRIDMLLGAELFFDLLKEGKIKLSNDLPMVTETEFGWIVTGPVPNSSVSCHVAYKCCSEFNANENVDEILRKFWEIEECFTLSNQSLEEQQCENHFVDTHYRENDGRYGVMLPFRDTHLCLGRSKLIAEKRLLMLERKLLRFPDLKLQYVKFMNEYIQLGHCKEIIDTENEPKDGKSFYLPHHSIVKAQSSSTRLRVVFDASSKSSTNISLNDLLMVGPVVQDDLFTIIMRFRMFKYAFTADLSKMYRQVRVHPSQTSFQRILWRQSATDKIKTYELTTVTYGTASAAFLATRVLKQLAEDEQESYPIASSILKRDFYVDDVLSGAGTIKEALEGQSQLIGLLKCGGFHIHKWCSNVPELLDQIPSSDREKTMLFDECDANDTIKTLGILWCPVKDEFTFRVNLVVDSNQINKRGVLSALAKLFDPLGLVGPVTVKMKIFMQELWRANLEWDEQLPIELSARWQRFCMNLPVLESVKIPRFVLTADECKRIELCGFADASLRAYGACVYLCVWTNGKPNLSLLCSKSKVSPITSKTPEELKIVRLELNAAVLLSILIDKVKKSFRIDVDVALWSDSKVVLSWLKKAPKHLNVYVANRVTKVLSLTYGMNWYYVPTELNPADLVSRGVYPEQLINNKLWWNGPSQLFESESMYKRVDDIIISDDCLPELRIQAVSAVGSVDTPFEMLCKFESYRKTQRVFAYVLRFIDNVKGAKTKSNKTVGELSVTELRNATKLILRRVQREGFRFNQDGGLKHDNRLSNLNPFVDADGLIRVGGRIGHAKISYDRRHQIVLPADHHITAVLVRELHIENLHIGQSGLLAQIRQKYWPIRAKHVVRKIVRGCIRCFRSGPRKIEQFMGNLPGDRVSAEFPFCKTGVDYAGPVYLKQRQRKAAPVKGYIAVFICMVTKAFHIELVSDLSTSAFVAALQRFVSRRGNVSDIYSDNGTNFVGAERELRELRELFINEHCNRAIQDFCRPREINFHFIPPRAPNFGGLWEAGVKSVKTHLKRVLGESRVTYEEMNTLLVQIEGILNSRPLTATSDDANDLAPLTPAHFLIGREITAIAEPSYDGLKENRLSRWQYVQRLRQSFWQRWSIEYLTSLQHRSKWYKNRHEIDIGMLVVIREENVPPLNWVMGRIVEKHPGSDGIVRVVTIRTPTGVVKRSVSKISILPVATGD